MHELNFKGEISIKTKKLLKSWIFWIIIFTLIMIALFFFMENQSNKMQPTTGWSIPIGVIESASDDYRVLDIMERPNKEGILITYIVDSGIELYELNWFGEIERSILIEEDVSDIKVLDVGYNESSYNIYISDRTILQRYSVDMDNLSVGAKTLISETSEQFSVSEEAVIVGDDDITKILFRDQVVESIEDYEDLKRVNILATEEKIVATMDTVIGSSIITVDDGGVKIEELISPAQENILGYLQDIYLEDGVITVLSSKHHVGENFPSSFGMWQLNKDLEILNHEQWYHNRTSLRPVITNVDGNNIEYILGVLTRQDENRQAVLAQPRLQDGTFTNILRFTVENSNLIHYDRLTTTREYPIGYEYYKTNDGDVVVWADRVEDNANIRLAGMGDKWISYANENYNVDYIQISSEILMSFVASIIWGIVFAAIDLLDYILPIIIFIILLVIYNRVATFERDKKDLYLFLIVAVFVTGFKFYVSAIGNEGLQVYGHIYPHILGNDVALGTISIITSICSLLLVNLWYNGNKDLSINIHILMYIGFEVYFYLFSIMVYVVSAMSKVSLMI